MNNIRGRVFRAFPRDCKSAGIYRAARNDNKTAAEGGRGGEGGPSVRPLAERELFDGLERRVDATWLFVRATRR